MAKRQQFEEVDVAAVLIQQGDRFLSVYNPHWMTFSIPMTKRRIWNDPHIPPAHREEEWIDAAARAVAEHLGRTVTRLKLRKDIAKFQQSDRDGVWKHYHIQVFTMPWMKGFALLPGHIAEWLTPAEFLDEKRRPISTTARRLLKDVLGDPEQ